MNVTPLELESTSAGTRTVSSYAARSLNCLPDSLFTMRTIFSWPLSYHSRFIRCGKTSLVDSLLYQERMDHGEQIVERTRIGEIDSRLARHKQTKLPVALNVVVASVLPFPSMAFKVD